MPPTDLLIPFLLATAVFASVPGSGMLYAAAQTLSLGRSAGWWSALGFHIAGLGHIAAAALGISALLTIVPALFTLMKFAGAVYLVWMGINYLTSAPPKIGGTAAKPTARKALRDSIIVEALNPKTALFYLAFLPQFTDISATLPIG